MNKNIQNKGGQNMKNYLLSLMMFGVTAITSCTTQNQTRRTDDDIYYSSKDVQPAAPAPAPQQQSTSPSDYTQNTQQNNPENNQQNNSDQGQPKDNSGYDYSNSSTQ